MKWAEEKDAKHFSLQKKCTISDQISMVDEGDVHLLRTALMLGYSGGQPWPVSWKELCWLTGASPKGGL